MKKTHSVQIENREPKTPMIHEGNLVEKGATSAERLERPADYSQRFFSNHSDAIAKTVLRLEEIAGETKSASIEELMMNAENSTTYSELFQEALSLKSRLSFLKRS
jgi:hypothetical protein